VLNPHKTTFSREGRRSGEHFDGATGGRADDNGPVQLLLIIWASPATLLGLIVGAVGLTTGGHARRVGRTLEFHGGFVTWLLARCPVKPSAMTLGHVVLGRTEAALDRARGHELVHVRQYERWGPLFIPAYLLCSLVLFIRRRDPYRDNPFEKEAYREVP
jgi:hypothetical protein